MSNTPANYANMLLAYSARDLQAILQEHPAENQHQLNLQLEIIKNHLRDIHTIVLKRLHALEYHFVKSKIQSIKRQLYYHSSNELGLNELDLEEIFIQSQLDSLDIKALVELRSLELQRMTLRDQAKLALVEERIQRLISEEDACSFLQTIRACQTYCNQGVPVDVALDHILLLFYSVSFIYYS
ncbi:hypothetical protein GJ496_003729 [Pomphorhynchus laevis]|nr:hypothetical protein GJ496_003729 [Pomphorhynchus laevis]